MYLVTAASPTLVSAQKIMHLITPNSTKFMSKTYTTHSKHTRILQSPPQAQLPDTLEPALPPLLMSLKQSRSPIPKAVWESDSEDDK